MIQVNLFPKEKETYKHGKQMYGYQRGKRCGGRINWEFGIKIYTLLCIKYITNKDLLYSTENYIQYFVNLSIFFFYSYYFILFIYPFLAVLGLRFVRGLSLVTASGGHSSSQCGDRSSSRCAGLSPSRPLPLRGTGSRRAGSAVVAHGPSCSVACGILPDQGSNPCPLH